MKKSLLSTLLNTARDLTNSRLLQESSLSLLCTYHFRRAVVRMYQAVLPSENNHAFQRSIALLLLICWLLHLVLLQALNANFPDMEANLIEGGSGAAWEAYDKNEDLDILLTGEGDSGSDRISKLYQNKGESFTDMQG